VEKNTYKPVSFETGFFNSYGTYVHPTTIIDKNVSLGENVKIGPFCTITGKIYIDSNTKIHGYVSLGTPAQDVNTEKPLGSVQIGKNCDIREFVTISSPKIKENKTIIGNNCYVMNFSHIAHDVILEDNVTMINNVNLGGHVHVGKNVMLMANTAIHQFCRVGQYSALAPFSGMRQDLPPFCLFDGRPGKFAGLNIVALKRAGFTSDRINKIKNVTKLFFQDKLPLDEIFKLANLDEPFVKFFLNFAKTSDRGISRKTIRD